MATDHGDNNIHQEALGDETDFHEDFHDYNWIKGAESPRNMWRRRMVDKPTISPEYRAPMLEQPSTFRQTELAAVTVGTLIHFVLLYVIYKYAKKRCCRKQEQKYAI